MTTNPETLEHGTPTEAAEGPLRTSRLAVGSLVCAFLGWFPPLGLLAVILGVAAMRRIDKPQLRLQGHGVAVAGTVLGGGLALVISMASILLPAIGGRHGGAQRMENSTRVRGIQQGMFQYAQGNSQKYPGLGKDEALPGHRTASRRLEIMIQGNFFTAEYAISPNESGKTPNSALHTSPNGPHNDPTDHFSYALLEIWPDATGRVAEWASTANSEAAVVFDRETAGAAGSGARSIHSTTDWRGSVAYNDNHVFFETSNILERTRYGDTLNERAADRAVDDLWADRNAGGGTGSNALGVYD